MWLDSLKLVVPIALMLVLLGRKVHLALAILASGVSMGLLFGMSPAEMGGVAARAVIARETIEFVLIVYAVLSLVQIMKAKDSLGRMVSALRGLLRRKKLVITLPPAIIGLLPMPAGALLPAPILNETLRDDQVSPAVKTYINYWFRHIWEYSLPLSPGVIAAAAVFRVDVMRVTAATALFPLLAMVIGTVVMNLALPNLREFTPQAGRLTTHLAGLLGGLWEILAIIGPILFLRGPMTRYGISTLAVLGLVTTVSWLTLGLPWRERLQALLRAFNPTLLLTSVAIMVFTAFIVHSPQVLDVTRRLIDGAGPFRAVVMFLVPFVIGFLTGISNAFAGITFPLFLSVVGGSSPDMVGVMFLYVAGFCGVLLSPVHFCLVLSAEYYGARLKDVYRYLLPSVIVVALVATLIYLWKGGAP